MTVNVKSAYLTCRQVLPVMERQGIGAIVNNASIAAWGWCDVNYGAYGTSKGAMVSMTRSTPFSTRARAFAPILSGPVEHAARAQGAHHRLRQGGRHRYADPHPRRAVPDGPHGR